MGNVIGASDLIEKVKESYPDKVIFKSRYEYEFTRQKGKRKSSEQKEHHHKGSVATKKIANKGTRMAQKVRAREKVMRDETEKGSRDQTTVGLAGHTGVLAFS